MLDEISPFCEQTSCTAGLVKIERNCCYFEADVLARSPPSRINFLADVSDRLLSAARDESHDNDGAADDDDS